MPTTTLPYEFHVTVEAMPDTVEQFTALCAEAHVKPIVLDLGVNNGRTLADHMTSSTGTFESDEAAYQNLQEIAGFLGESGLRVIRRKIETVPWHPKAPQTEDDAMPDGSYFESHVALRLTEAETATLRDQLKTDETAPALHLSRNAFKQAVDGRLVMMTTLREYDVTADVFACHVDQSVAYLKGLGHELEKDPIVEFALYDSNTHHDDTWMEHEQ